MATRKKKTFAPLSWLRAWRQRLTSRMACFVWGAILGNAVLSHPIQPLNLLLEPPEHMLSTTARDWLALLRTEMRQLGGTVSAAVGDATTHWLRTRTQDTHPQAPAAEPATTRSGDFADCADQFPAQRPLHVVDTSTQWAPLALCADAFAVLYSGLTKTPLVVVEKLNRQRLQHAAGLVRTDAFYADTRIPAPWRADLSDYQGSGYDRGHLAAAANQPDAQAMAQSFALSNMVPQDPTHNRRLWAKLEADVRKYALRTAGNVYVFTGSLHEGPTQTLGRNAVWIPSHLFKLVYDESQQRAWAYVLPNRADARITRPMDYAAFVERTGWPLLRGLPVVGSIR